MGILGDAGMPNLLGGTNIAGVGKSMLLVLVIFLVVAITGVFAFIHYSKKLKQKQFCNAIPIFKQINGKRTRIDVDRAKEVFIPDTNVSLYYLEKRKIYIARPTRAMGKDEYWYSISPNGEWVNFDLSMDSELDTLSKADYDHRDTRYAYINLKEIIKRNYSDKSIKWWKEYAPLITFVVVGFVFILGCWILLAKIGKLIIQLQPLAENMKLISENLARAGYSSASSGVISSS